MQIHLKKGETIYINGAVIKADHRCSIELVNNVNFLLESHVMQQEKAASPIKQIYFAVQTMLIKPEEVSSAQESYWRLSSALQSSVQIPTLINGLLNSDICVRSERYYDALKVLRGLFEIERVLLRKMSNG